jgi:hypothetical protein
LKKQTPVQDGMQLAMRQKAEDFKSNQNDE